MDRGGRRPGARCLRSSRTGPDVRPRNRGKRRAVVGCVFPWVQGTDQVGALRGEPAGVRRSGPVGALHPPFFRQDCAARRGRCVVSMPLQPHAARMPDASTVRAARNGRSGPRACVREAVSMWMVARMRVLSEPRGLTVTRAGSGLAQAARGSVDPVRRRRGAGAGTLRGTGSTVRGHEACPPGPCGPRGRTKITAAFPASLPPNANGCLRDSIRLPIVGFFRRSADDRGLPSLSAQTGVGVRFRLPCGSVGAVAARAGNRGLERLREAPRTDDTGRPAGQATNPATNQATNRETAQETDQETARSERCKAFRDVRDCGWVPDPARHRAGVFDPCTRRRRHGRLSQVPGDARISGVQASRGRRGPPGRKWACRAVPNALRCPDGRCR